MKKIIAVIVIILTMAGVSILPTGCVQQTYVTPEVLEQPVEQTVQQTITSTATATPMPTSTPNPTSEETSENATFSLNLDNDGLDDTVEILQDIEESLIRINITLGNGHTYSDEFDAYYYDKYDVVDLTGDGKNELLIISDYGTQGGCGQIKIDIYTVNEQGGVEKLPMPMMRIEVAYDYPNGYDFKINYKDGFKFDVLRRDGTPITKNHVLSDDQKEEFIGWGYYAESGKCLNSNWDGWADGFFSCKVIEYNGMSALEVPQYLCWFSHSNELGYIYSVISWPNGKLKLLDQYFSYENDDPGR